MALANPPSWEFIPPPAIDVVFARASAEPAPPRKPLTQAELALVPKRPLRLAEFLFHCNRVSWQDCCDAVRWQREQRPTVGQIAIGFGWLSQEQVARILRDRVQDRAFRRGFCEYAVEKGDLTEAQAAAVLARQRRQQRRIGDYFVERGLLTRDEVEAMAAHLRAHNARHRGAR